MPLDKAQLQRVFTNLVLNAAQAMPDGGQLTIETSECDDWFSLSFCDTGVGIGEENLRKMFTPFFTTKVGGVGLGLNICRQIVEGHGGEISVNSKEGCGSTFTVKFPIRTMNEPKAPTFVCPAIETVEVKRK
jgi:signal transduction histidine kinase